MPDANPPAPPHPPESPSESAPDPMHLARLARIRMTPQEAQGYAAQLTRILDLVAQMNRIDTDGAAPMSHPQDGALRLRDDDARDDDRRAAHQRIAPSTERGLYLVPKVIE